MTISAIDVVFPVMPFADVGRPAIGVSLLKAAVERAGFRARVLYLNWDLADHIGLTTYSRISNGFPPNALIGEWFFAGIVFGTAIPDVERYCVDVLGKLGIGTESIGEILEARHAHAESFVTGCVERILELHPRIVGFSTTFHQTCACLAVAKRLKALQCPPIVVFGGANCEGDMGRELLRQFNCIDFVSTREADISFPAFVTHEFTARQAENTHGIIGRGGDGGRPLVTEMDQLPVPDYTEYFEMHAQSSLRDLVKPELLIETSRGCWWGEKQHCTFCGLNGETMAFRRKSPDRVFDELQYLSERFGCPRVEAVDNILDMSFIRTLFPRLAQSGLGLELFFEVKANLTLEQLRQLRNGGMVAIQPGIESFSHQVLKLMRKGCSGLQNIRLLRWSQEVGIATGWNILVGFPGEDPDEYRKIARIIPMLTHLTPPASCSTFRLDRFSPFFTDPESMGISRVRPAYAYFFVFPFGRRVLTNLAYYFEFDFVDARDPSSYTRELNFEVAQWVNSHALQPEGGPRLDAYWNDKGVEIVDTRACAVRSKHQLQGLSADVYLVCDTAHTFEGLSQKLGRGANASEVHLALDELINDKLTVELDGQFLSLAVMRQRINKTLETHETMLAATL